MATVAASEVNNLRKQTGAGMMDCKNALVESNGDIAKAIEWLRKKGQKIAANREERDAKEGLVISRTSSESAFGIIIQLNCETDFVAKNEEFIQLAENIAGLAIKEKAKTLEELYHLNLNDKSVDESIKYLSGKIGEKICLSNYDALEASTVAAYTHPGNRVASLVGLSDTGANNNDIHGREVAMQVAAMNPLAIDRDDVPMHIVDKEIEIGKHLAMQEGKPAELAEKIARGRLNKFFEENTLLNQPYIKENKKSVKQFLSEKNKNLKITGFKRYSV